MAHVKDCHYDQRMAQLVLDGYMVQQGNLQLTALGNRVLPWLIEHGYLRRGPAYSLTTRGLSVLLACADRRVAKQLPGRKSKRRV